jgi:hypothetical protein
LSWTTTATAYLSVFQDAPAFNWFVSIERNGRRKMEFGLLFGCGIRLLLGAQRFADPDGCGDARDDEQADGHGSYAITL